ncbi:FAD-dependent oxidoreductase [Sutterella sp.]|uniref:FAD-dependent oxidoreductase n=1 Tax=Sutterella sp. TaxID=1981025 RepID=UPI0026DEF60F|nr:FAD-dependent oxidoreductase [Sutterella sp.]MDO5531355.1 FAD-dependent oxidoreductase [Sutterella sp.]
MEDTFLYGFWNGRRFDRRANPESQLPDGFPMQEAAEFNRGNPVTSVIAPQGFLIFKGAASLPRTLHAYYSNVRRLSCGRCTPCRIGSIMICEALEQAINGKGSEVDWAHVRNLARQMQISSLCGIGYSTGAAMIGAVEGFLDMLQTTAPVPDAGTDVTLDGRYVSAATAPCIEACPANINVPRYIDYIRDGQPDLAEGVLLERYPLVGTCGRVCVRPCEKACARRFNDAPIAIKDMKRYAADKTGLPVAKLFEPCAAEGEEPKKRVAVVGAGPAGINCAYHLLQRGRDVDVYDMEPEAGGMARWGIPSYRLPRQGLAAETDVVKSLGGRFFFGQKLGRDFGVNDLFAKGYDAVFLGIGCANGQYLGLPEEDQEAEGYLKGLDFLLEAEHAQLTPEGPKGLDGDVVVIGCGNVAMDCCRVARRLMTKGKGRVVVAYRRIEASAPADPEEIKAARAEGVEFEFLCAPNRIITKDGQVKGIELVRMYQTEPDASGRRAVKPVPGSEFCVPCRYVIAAIGQKVDTSVIRPEDGVALSKWGTIETKADYTTSRPGVFAGGDGAVGAKTLILAMSHGEGAAKSIDEYLKSGEPAFFPRKRLAKIIKNARLLDQCRPKRPLAEMERFEVKMLDPVHRIEKGPWEEVEFGMTHEEAWKESKRCMRCYRLIAVTARDPVPASEKTTAETPAL